MPITYVVREPAADELLRVLRLRGGGNNACADGPDGLVGDDDVSPRVGGHGVDAGLDGGELRGDNGVGVAVLAVLERLAHARNNREAVLKRDRRLGADRGVDLG